MARYIDADKLKKDFPQSVSKHNVIINGNEYPVFLVDHVLHKIRNYPTADVVKVVRCKDCRMFVENKKAFVAYCKRELKNLCVKPNDFCSYGEKRSAEE